MGSVDGVDGVARQAPSFAVGASAVPRGGGAMRDETENRDCKLEIGDQEHPTGMNFGAGFLRFGWKPASAFQKPFKIFH